MLLKSVDIQGFKTFPDKTSLKFDEKMVAVVGPNGSGKSNVSDAIRWVLGEQSTRVLRCSKMEDVIFKGTTSRKALGFAEVTMNIDNTDRTLNFDNDNLAITRRYYRSGDSEYLINKSTVRLKDINELFMDTGLGRDGYSIIGQGKIDSIVAAKSEERREIFEEASGVSRYRYKKEESERRLARAEENLVRLRDIVGELEERVEPLRIQAEKAKKFSEYDREKRGLEIGVWVKNLSEFEKVLRDQGEKTQITLSQHNSIEENLEKITAQNEENYREISHVNMTMENERNNAVSLDEQALSANGQILVFNNDMEHNNQNIRRIDQELAAIENSNEDIDLKISESKNRINTVEQDLSENNKKYMEFSYEMENLRSGTDSYQTKINTLTEKSAKLSADISTEQIKISSFTTSKEEVENRGETLEKSILENQFLIEKSEKNAVDLEKFLGEITDKITEKNNSLNGYNLIANQKRDKASNLKTEIDNLNLNAQEQSRRAKILEDLERNYEGFANSVKVVMRESTRGTLRGVHGPVTKILNTPRDYAVAVETALGGAMQNIVVDTEQDAKTAINFLKNKQSGRATFLPLSVIRGTAVDAKEVENLFGFVGVASNLVSCQSQYNGIKNSLLGRTIVAEDLDSAVVIAKKISYRFRVVSLDGQVVNSGGSLTGGSSTKNSGLLSRSGDIQRIREKAAEILAQVGQKTELYKSLTAEFNQALALVETEKLDITRLNEDKVRTSTEIFSVKKEITAGKNLQSQLKLEQSNATLRLNNINKNMEKSQSIIKQLENDLANVNVEYKELLNTQEFAQDQIRDVATKMQDIKMQGFEILKNKEILESSLQILIERKTHSETVVVRYNEEKLEYTQKIEILKEQIEQTQVKIDDLKKQSENARVQITLFAQKREELESVSTKLRESERDYLNQREQAGKELARLQERMESLQKEYDTIIKKLWEEYELTRKEAAEQAVEIEDIKKANQRLIELKSKIRGLGSVNLSAIEEYAQVSERYEFLSVQVNDVEKSKAELLKLIAQLTTSIKEQFSVRFAEIASNFTTIFKDLFGGGTASLSFTDDSDILNSGIEIKVHPPGKIVSHIEALSGGEKALVAISIYFAIMKVNPPPFCMLDEVEAALDDVNVRRFAEYLQKMNESTQFIVITHRRGTMESADILYGVTMQDDGISKLLALKNHEIEKMDLK